jgi:hypothetical protein
VHRKYNDNKFESHPDRGPCDLKLHKLYFYECNAVKGIHEPGDDPYEMAVAEGWNLAKSFSVDKEGFSLHNFKTGYDQ